MIYSNNYDNAKKTKYFKNNKRKIIYYMKISKFILNLKVKT